MRHFRTWEDLTVKTFQYKGLKLQQLPVYIRIWYHVPQLWRKRKILIAKSHVKQLTDTSNLTIAPQSKWRRVSVAFKLSSHVTYCAFQVVKQRETHNSSSGSNIYLWLLNDCTGLCILNPSVSIFINWTKQSSDGAPSLLLSVCSNKKLHIRLIAFLMRTGGLWALWVCIFRVFSALNFPRSQVQF